MTNRTPQDLAAPAPAPGSGAGLGRLPQLARRFLAESFFKNSAALIINLGVSAICGYGGLAILTHVFSVRDVGVSATAVSAMSLITSITLLGVTYSLPRYLPTTKHRAAMINTLVTAVILITAVACLVFLVLPYARKFFVLGGWLPFALVFIVTSCAAAGTTVLSTVLVADRASDKVATYGTVANLSRLFSPSVFVFIGALGCYVARVVTDIVSFVVYGVVVARRGHRFRPALSLDVVREVGRFSFGMYLANMVGGLPQLLLPLIALSRVGATQAAYWSVATSIAGVLFSLPSMVATALLPEVSFRPAERRQLLRRASLLTLAIVAPALAVAFLLAPYVLDAFGSGYSAGAVAAVRWMILGGVITIFNAVTGAILFIAKKSTNITIVNAVNAVVVIGLVAAWATTATDIGEAWFIGDIANTVLFVGFAVLALREVGWRWDKLGGDQVEGVAAEPAAAEPAGIRAPAAASAELMRDLRTTMVDQQRAVDQYRPWPSSLTQSQELFSVAAVRAAERQREHGLDGPGGAGSRWGAPDRLSGYEALVDTHERALQVLFALADQQRKGRGGDPEHPPPAGTEAGGQEERSSP